MERLLKPKEISCRVQSINENGLSLLLYVTSRAGQNLLDEKYGPLGWQDSYREIGGELYCTISAWDESKQQWVSKEDVGTASYTEKEKGRASDAFKRACVKHGIARELYSAPFIWIPAGQCNIRLQKDRYTTRDKFTVNDITYNAAGEIDALKIMNQDMDIVFEQFPSGKISDIQRTALLKAMENAEVSLNDILNICNIKDLRDMDINQYSKVCIKLQVTAEAKGKAK